MASSTIVKTLNDGTIAFTDAASPTPNTVTLALDRGTLSISGPVRLILRETVVHERKGIIQSFSQGNRTYPTFTVTCYLTEFTATSGTGLAQYLLGLAAA